jgi:hypothetical protein
MESLGVQILEIDSANRRASLVQFEHASFRADA